MKRSEKQAQTPHLLAEKEEPVSIVLAACNGEAYLSEQLESIIDQMQPEDELIISLDPSQDQSARMIEEWIRRAPWCTIRRVDGPGKGAPANFERGLLEAGKDLIVLSDQDDRWHPQKLALIRQAFRDPKLCALVHDAAVCNEKLEVIEPSFFQFHQSRPGFWNNLVRNSFVGACMALRKSVVDACLPFPPIPMHDQFLGLQAQRMGRVVFLPEVLIDYRRHAHTATSLTSASSLKQKAAWRLQMLKALSLRPVKPRRS